MELAISALQASEQQRFQDLLQRAEAASIADLDAVCDELQVTHTATCLIA